MGIPDGFCRRFFRTSGREPGKIARKRLLSETGCKPIATILSLFVRFFMLIFAFYRVKYLISLLYAFKMLLGDFFAFRVRIAGLSACCVLPLFIFIPPKLLLYTYCRHLCNMSQAGGRRVAGTSSVYCPNHLASRIFPPCIALVIYFYLLVIFFYGLHYKSLIFVSIKPSWLRGFK